MLDTTGKLLEKLIVRRLRNYLDATGAISNNQFGFRRNMSTLDAMAVIREMVKRANGRSSAYNKVVGLLT